MPFLIFEDAGGRKKGVAIDSVTIIGREVGCDIRIPNPLLSRKHCRFMQTPQGWMVQDLKSSRGTFIEGQRITQQVLAGGEVLSAEDIKVTFLAQAPARAKKRPASAASTARAAQSSNVEDQVLDVLTVNRDDDEADERSAMMDAEMAAIRRELAGESTDVLDESDTDTNVDTVPAASVAASAGSAPAVASQPPAGDTSRMRGANLWSVASAPAPMGGKSKKKSTAGAPPGRGATSAEMRGEAGGGGFLKWDKKTIIALVVVSLVVITVALELTGNLPFDLFH